MKTMKFLTYTVFVLFLSFAISSCDGDDGATGPAGVDGVDGVDGTDGNANVIYSDWIDAPWTTPATSASFTHASTDFTLDVLDKAVIMVYMGFPSPNTLIYPLPFTTGGTNSISFLFMPDLGQITFFYNATTAFNGAGLKFRYVIIPPADSSKSSIESKQSIYNELEAAKVDINDYYDVCAYYDIDPE